MKTSMKTWLIIIVGLALLAGVAVLTLRSRRDQPDDSVGANVSNTSGVPSFEVRVVVPRGGLPLGGILPNWFVRKLDGTPHEMRFDHTSRGAKIGSVARDRLEFTADGWDFSIATDGEGRITPGARLVIDMALGGNKVKLRCRPANPGTGYLDTTARAGSDELSGRFLVELATCENAESGKLINWPPAPLTVRGSFAGLSQRHR
jgi:hypothetical protein